MSRFTLDDHERQRLRTTPWRTLDPLEWRRALTTTLAIDIPDITRLLANNTDRDLKWAEAALTKLQAEQELTQKQATETPAEPNILTHGSERVKFVDVLPETGQKPPVRNYKLSWQANELKKRPGKWALLREEKDRKRIKNYAYAVRTGRLAAFQPVGAFEARCITRHGTSGLYARYAGSKK